MSQLTVATYNIHKGFSTFNQRVVLHDLRERLHEFNADIVFLQKVLGEHNFACARISACSRSAAVNRPAR